MRTITRLTFALVLFVIAPRVVNACGCYSNATVLDDYENADLVIIARTKSLTKTTTPNRFGNYVSHAIMVVDKVFKGEVKTGEELTFTQGDPVLGCTWEFYEDIHKGEYLLYLYWPEKRSDPLYISTCNRSKTLESAHEDLLYLNNIDKVRGRTRISGVVEVDGEDENNEGLQIRIRGKNKTYIATTDKNGVYELYDLPPGRYLLEPVLKTGWKVEEFNLTRPHARPEWGQLNLDQPSPNKLRFTLRPKRHVGVNINLTTQ